MRRAVGIGDAVGLRRSPILRVALRDCVRTSDAVRMGDAVGHGIAFGVRFANAVRPRTTIGHAFAVRRAVRLPNHVRRGAPGAVTVALRRRLPDAGT